MPIIPIYKPSTTGSVVDNGFSPGKDRTITIHIENKPRGYMGLSGIGYTCGRQAQFIFRLAFENTITWRTRRIFDTGHIAEEFIIEDLHRIGVIVTNQQAEIVGFAGHWKGHIDGECIGVIEAPKTTHLLEMKTMADKYFKIIIRDGTKIGYPKYYDQTQAYMGYRKLTRCLFVAYNKNTSHYYFERIKFDTGHFNTLKIKEHVILEDTLLPTIGNPKTWYECKLCRARDLCLGSVDPVRNCRTCQYGDAENNGVWSCSFPSQQKELTLTEQINGCGKYEVNRFFNGIYA